jgi:hypothetical protein
MKFATSAIAQMILRIVVSRTVEQVLCSVADGDGSANRYQRQNGPLSDRDTKCQA